MSPASATLRQAVEDARKYLAQNPLYLDTETTGIEKSDTIIEIAVVNDTGQTIFQSLVRPQKSMPPEVVRVHHITDDMVKSAPNWAVVWTQLRPILTGRKILTYNSDFDLRMFQQTHEEFKLPAILRSKLDFECIMKLYARYRGEWDDRRGAFRYHSLDAAGKASGISLPNSHRAADDTLLARALLHYMAETHL